MIAPIFVAIAGLASVAVAQSDVGVGNQTIVPSSVDVNTRNGWCRAQQNTCTTLCNKDWTTNDCTIDPLEAVCECADGSTPELATFRDTLPFFVCHAYIGQCVDGNDTLPVQQNICRSTNICGDLDPDDVEFTSTVKSTSGSPTATSGSPTGSDSPAETTGADETPSTTPNAAVTLAPSSTGLLGATLLLGSLVLAGFGLVL